MPTDPIAPWPLVKRGARIFPVRSLQQLVRARNHPVAVDGIFGPNTESAVKAFQQSNSLAADGIVGPDTWPKLVVQVKRGSNGDAVRGVQEVMKFHDQSDGEGSPVLVDGHFRPTHRRLRTRVPDGRRDYFRRDRRPDHMARAGQRHAVGLTS
jgi:peptidoglycan hydrolase-like protein with peptidoglycan-binding domain